MSKKYLTALYSAAFSAYLGSLFIFKNSIVSLLNSNLPFREAYNPSYSGLIFLYLLPLFLGLIVGGVLNNRERSNSIYFINLALIAGLINYLPFIFVEAYLRDYWFNNLTLAYYLVLFPVLFLIGESPYFVNKTSERFKEDQVYRLSTYDLSSAIILGLGLFFVNLLPLKLSNYLVGADIYYHGTMSLKMSEGLSIWRSPIFWESKNYYYSIVYPTIAFLANISKINVQWLWSLTVPLSAAIFIFFFYLFCKRITGSTIAAWLAVIFVLPINQILWVDPSVRIVSYAWFGAFIYSFLIFVYRKRFVYLAISMILLLLTASTHPEIAIHLTGIVTCYFVLIKFRALREILEKIIKEISRFQIPIKEGFYMSSISKTKSLLILLSIFVAIFFYRYQFLLRNYSIDKIMVFNEIPLSVLQPVGPISFLVFLFAPFGIIRRLKRKSNSDIFLLSMAALFMTVFFYFSHLWTFYHRYFAETAYFALAIFAAEVIRELIRKQPKGTKTLLGLVIVLLFLISIVPKFRFIQIYAKGSGSSIESKISDIKFLEKIGDRRSVVLTNPNDIISRYIPFYADRFIFSGSGSISKEHQWQVLSFCNGPYRKDCDRRVELSDLFFSSPSLEILDSIKREYKIDFLMIRKDAKETKESMEKSDLNLDQRKLGESQNYEFYDLQNI